MHLVFPNQKTAALMALEPGQSLLVPLNASSLQSVQSTIASIARKHGYAGAFSSRKALLILDEHHRPIPLVLITRREDKL